jgi:spore coat protein SA
MIYYLLNEPFSSSRGLALSRIVASMMRKDDASVVICPEADDSWGFPSERVRVVRRLLPLSLILKGSNMRGWRFLPVSVRRFIICRLLSSLLSLLKAPDIVWCYNWPYVAEALERATRFRGALLVYHAQNSIAAYDRVPLFHTFKPDAYVFNSEAIRQEALAIWPAMRNTFTVHNGADESLFFPPPSGTRRNNETPVILYAGRLVPEKGAHVLLDAMWALWKNNVRCTCKIVGSAHAGRRRDSNSAYIRSLLKRCPPNVMFLGFLTAAEIAEQYRAADIFCCPSIWQEPFGLVNIEAMASGLPVVASRVGGIPEIAAHGGVVLVEPGSPTDLAHVLADLLGDKERREEIASSGVVSFQRYFTSTAIYRQYAELLVTLTEPKPLIT